MAALAKACWEKSHREADILEYSNELKVTAATPPPSYC